MKKITISLEFDDGKLGPEWLNMDNIKLMLFSKKYTKKELVKTELVRISTSGNYTDKKDK